MLSTGGARSRGANAGWDDCNGFAGDGCESSLVSVDHCGTCGTACTNAHGTTGCVGGTCAPECDTGWGSCNGNPDDGCETFLRTLTDCGSCGTPCDIPNASESCSTGTCQLAACNVGYDNCDGNQTNGCELNHEAYSNSCSAAEVLGGFCGDVSCGLFCPTSTRATEHRIRVGATPPGTRRNLRLASSYSERP